MGEENLRRAGQTYSPETRESNDETAVRAVERAERPEALRAILLACLNPGLEGHLLRELCPQPRLLGTCNSFGHS